MDYYYVLQLLLIGVSVGLISNALGLGGGIVMVPAFLLFVDGMDTNTAKGSSLLIIMLVASVNAWRLNVGYEHKPWKLAATIALGSIVGGYFGAWVTGLMPDVVVTWLFIGFLALVAIRTFFIIPPHVSADQVRQRNLLAVVVGFCAGTVAGATGTGGGAVLVPMVLMAGIITNERVVALSNMVMIATATAATAAHLMAKASTNLPHVVGHVDLALAPLVFIGAMASAPLGRRLNLILTIKRRRVVLGILLLVIVVRLVNRALG